MNKLVIFYNKNVTFKMVQVSYKKRRFAEANLAFFLGGGGGGVSGSVGSYTQTCRDHLAGYQVVVDKC